MFSPSPEPATPRCVHIPSAPRREPCLEIEKIFAPFGGDAMLPRFVTIASAGYPPKGVCTMEWVTPQHEEIDLNCEVSSYANSEL